MINIYLGILCTLASVPGLALRLMPFMGSINRRKKIVVLSFSIGVLLCNFLICIVLGVNGHVDIPFYKRDLLVVGLILMVCEMVVIRRYPREQLFVFGLVALLTVSIFAMGAFMTDKIGYRTIEEGLIIENILGLFFFCGIYPLFEKVLRETVTPFLDENSGHYWKMMWLFPFVMFVGIHFSMPADSYITTPVQLIGRISIVAAVMMFCGAVARDARRNREKEALQQQVGQQKKYYEALAQKVRAERKERHDFKHQIATIQTMVKKGNLEELMRYCDEAQQLLIELADVPQTGNAAADSILYHYALQAQQEGIDFSVNGSFGDGSLPDGDVICLLGNALDNAFTACRTADKVPYVRVAVMNRNGSLMITVDNAFDGKLNEEDDVIYSGKRNHEEGIGIASMRDIVEKYNGICRFQAEGKEFEASFLLNLTV